MAAVFAFEVYEPYKELNESNTIESCIFLGCWSSPEGSYSSGTGMFSRSRQPGQVLCL